jgi:hypothetical protein
MQIKTTLRFHFTPVRMAIFQKINNINVVEEVVVYKESIYTVGRNVK